MTVARAERDLEEPTAILVKYWRRSISLAQLLERMWSGKLIIASAIVIGITFGAWKVHSAGPQYIATMVVSPADNDVTGGSASSGASALLNDLTGSGGTTAVPKYTQFLTSIYSVGVARSLASRYGMLCQVYTGDCDQKSHKWRERTGLIAWINGLLAKIGGLPDPNGARTADDLSDYITSYVTTEANKKSSIVILSFIDRRPQFAANFLSSIVAASNDYVRLLNRDAQRRYVDYLSQASMRTTNVQQRQTIDALLLQQERQLMMTEVDAPYAATVLDGPNVKPVNRVARILLLYGALGGILGSLYVLFRHLIPRRPQFGND